MVYAEREEHRTGRNQPYCIQNKHTSFTGTGRSATADIGTDRIATQYKPCGGEAKIKAVYPRRLHEKSVAEVMRREMELIKNNCVSGNLKPCGRRANLL